LQKLLNESKFEEYQRQALANPLRLERVEMVVPQWKQITRRDHNVVH